MGKTFYQYMKQFLGEDSPRGTLAEDMHYEQERSPFRNCDLNELRTWSQMNSYLNAHNAWDESRWTAKCCWQDYRNTPDCA